MLNTRQNLSKRDPKKLTLRRSLKAPAGHKFVSVDSSQIEARMLAFVAGEDELVEQFREGHDPYAELASKIFGISAKEIHDGAKSGDKRLKNYRNVGKTCILSCFAGDTEVLTDTGWKRIDNVSDNDKLWDGEQWQTHNGLICNGERNTINLDGINVTPDHMIFDGSSWITAGDCLVRRFSLNRALSTGVDALSTVPLNSGNLNREHTTLPILSPCPAGTTPTLRSTELTMMEITKSATSNSLPERRMLETIGVLTGCRNESTSLKKRLVYDIRNVGPRHRFVVRTTHGALLVHNCGYGVGWKKFSDTLLRQGVRLADDLEKHAELAKQAHMIYRMSNASIVAFWDTCQQVVEAMCSHVGGTFGAHNEFEYGYGPIAGTGVEAPYIELRGTGYRLWYPNLRWEKGERGRAEYFYDRPRGKNMVKTKLYGGALTENCCSRGTLVLTDSGWKPIEAVSINDLVYDGSSFVRHSGVVSRGIQDCIEVNGCWFTSDHLLMENGEWVYAKDCERPDRIEVWKAHSSMPYQFSEPSLALGVPMRLWCRSGKGRPRGGESCEAWQRTTMSCLCEKICKRQDENAWHDKDSHICSLAFYGTTLYRAFASSMESVWRAWHNSVRALEEVRELLRGYGCDISAWSGLGQDRQQHWVFAGELPLGDISGKCSERTKLFRSGRANAGKGNRNKSVNHILSAYSWMAHRIDSSHKTEQRKREAEVVQPVSKKAEVFDILNCGEQHCFTVKGNYPMLAHNCVQSIAFQLLMWQACEMDRLGIHLIANIHDAWLACVPEGKAEEVKASMESIMSSVPPWLDGFPVACEGEIGDSYEIA